MSFVRPNKIAALILFLLAIIPARPGPSFAGPDTSPPSSTITSPADGTYIRGTSCVVTGTSADDPGGSGVKRVEVSTYHGEIWTPATGTASWSYTWTLPNSATAVMWRVSSAWIRNMEGSDTRTVRVRHVLCADGSYVRVGFMSGPTEPLTVLEAYIGNDAGDGTVTGNVPLTFDGSGPVSVGGKTLGRVPAETWIHVELEELRADGFGNRTCGRTSHDGTVPGRLIDTGQQAAHERCVVGQIGQRADV